MTGRETKTDYGVEKNERDDAYSHMVHCEYKGKVFAHIYSHASLTHTHAHSHASLTHSQQ